jgi:Rod binding domain-containing protein
MTIIVEVPGHGEVEFPDGTSDEEIKKAIHRNFMLPEPKAAAKEMKKEPHPEPALFGRPTPPSDPNEAIEYVKQHSFGSGIPRLGYNVGEKVTDLSAKYLPPQGAAAAGFVANILTQAIPSLLTSANVVGQPAASLTNTPAKWLMQTAVKPSTDDLLSGAASKATQSMLDEAIAPTMSGWGLRDMPKVAKMTSQLDDQVGAAISASTAKTPVGAVASRLNETLEQAGMQVNPKTDINAVESAWTEFLTNPHIAGKKEIPVQLAHSLKKGTYKALGNKSYGEVGSTAVEAQKALARGLREEVAEAVPEIKPLIERQAALMNVRDVAGTRALLDANKNPLGLAALRVDHPLSSLSFMADRWGWLKALMAISAHRAGQAQTITPIGLATQGGLPSDPALMR